MRYDKLSLGAFVLLFASMFLCLAFLLLVMAIGKEYTNMPPGPLLPWAIAFVSISLAYAAIGVIYATWSAHGDEDERIEYLQSLIDSSWLFLMIIWLLKKSDTACLVAVVAYPDIMKKDN